MGGYEGVWSLLKREEMPWLHARARACASHGFHVQVLQQISSAQYCSDICGFPEGEAPLTERTLQTNQDSQNRFSRRGDRADRTSLHETSPDIPKQVKTPNIQVQASKIQVHTLNVQVLGSTTDTFKCQPDFCEIFKCAYEHIPCVKLAYTI